MIKPKTIEELLNSMQTKYKEKDPNAPKPSIKNLTNSKETWERIASGDKFEELDFDSDSEKEKFLADWIKDNPYNDI